MPSRRLLSRQLAKLENVIRNARRCQSEISRYERAASRIKEILLSDMRDYYRLMQAGDDLTLIFGREAKDTDFKAINQSGSSESIDMIDLWLCKDGSIVSLSELALTDERRLRNIKAYCYSSKVKEFYVYLLLEKPELVAQFLSHVKEVMSTNSPDGRLDLLQTLKMEEEWVDTRDDYCSWKNIGYYHTR